jgi:UDP-N-acetylmuramyl pentapeptide phosphotransferase/UDP-N-acetylglucosamine-1-phosphate transferase
VIPLILSFFISLGLGALVLGFRPLSGNSLVNSPIQPQRVHEGIVPRIGGLAVFVSFGAFYFLLTEEDERLIAKQIILGGAGVFLAGLAEDLTERVSPMMRLFTIIGCSLCLVLFSGISIKSMGLGGWEEALLGYWPAGVFVTVLCVAGMVNAFNFVDGLNGLAAGIASTALLAIGLVARGYGDEALVATCWGLLAASLGFLVVNWPLGRLFLGDCGAYFLGISLAWLAVLLPARNPSISPWVSFLVLAYPSMEILSTIARRIRKKYCLVSPDRHHLHSLMFERLNRTDFAVKSLLIRNSIAGFSVVMIASIAPIIAVAFHQDERLLITASLVYAAAYSVVYRWLA